MSPRSKQIIVITAPFLWLGLIWTLSSLPSDRLPAVKLLSIDKFLHLGEYLILALLANLCLRALGVRKPAVLLIYSLLLLNAGLDELHQTWIPNRSVSLWDYLANAAGLGLGLTAFLIKYDRDRKSAA